MASYLGRLESLIERWHSNARRRKSIEISNNRPDLAAGSCRPVARTAVELTSMEPNGNDDGGFGCHNDELGRTRSSEQATGQAGGLDANYVTNCWPADCGLDAAGSLNGRDSHPRRGQPAARREHSAAQPADHYKGNSNFIKPPPKLELLATCPNVLYAAILLLGALLAGAQQLQLARAASATTGAGPAEAASRQLIGALASPELAGHWRATGSRLAAAAAASLGARDRWANVPNGLEHRHNSRYRRQGHLSAALNRLRARIGARNSIRVHNAFRDFAWRVLSSMSMPTPVIYELRRQHFYSPADDMMNDSLYDKNTTKTVRSKRLVSLDSWLLPASLRGSRLSTAHRRAANDEEAEPDSFRGRLKSRLEDLVSLSRRSLFGRVIRVPSLFPFRRHESADSKGPPSSVSTNSQEKAIAANNKRQPARWRLRRRRQKHSDRQMISIDGKQYYVDDDGELKQLRDDADEADT